MFSRVLNNRLDKWAEEYNVYIEAQAGFRAGMGTVDNIFVLHGVIKRCLSEDKQLYATFVDFTKAFYYVVRENLWLKLIKSGVRGRILNVIQSMYKSVKKVQVGKDQEKAQSEKDSHSKNRGGKKPN